LIQKFFTSLSSVKEMEIPDIGELPPKKSDEVSLASSLEKEAVDLQELNYLPCLIFPKQDLRIRKYNRLVKDTHGHSDDQILAQAKQFFIISQLDPLKGT
jgi:uncharacterized protein (DUF1015 family)